jgi:hypothetical protein
VIQAGTPAHQGEDVKPGDTAPAGGDPACWAHLLCPACGAMTNEGHRPGCGLAFEPSEQ